MLAIDTNLIVRYLTGDHPKQAAQARTLIDGEDVFVGSTVLLEAEWVLRSAYGYTAKQLSQALRNFLGLPRVIMEEPAAIAQALDWTEAGMDFADALHLAKSAGCEAFVTFDRHFVRAASKLSGIKVKAP
jgi:predicted nucleic-acid-binding protein